MIVAGMATIYSRRDWLLHTARSIASQVDMLHLYCSGFEKSSLPRDVLNIENLIVFTMSELRSPMELGDAGKFFHIPHDCYYLSCDDDIYYEPGYAEYMVDAVDRYRKNAWITTHGVDIRLGKYPDCRKRISHFQKENQEDLPCMVPGTGVSAFHSSMMRVPITLFKYANCADMWIAYLLQKFEICCVAIENPHPKRLCRSMGDGKDSIWSKRINTDLFNNDILRLVKGRPKHFLAKYGTTSKAMRIELKDLQEEFANIESSFNKLKKSSEEAAKRQELALASSEKNVAKTLTISEEKLAKAESNITDFKADLLSGDLSANGFMMVEVKGARFELNSLSDDS